MFHSPPTDRRVRTPVLQQLEARVDCALTTLREALNADPSEAEHPDVISTMVIQTKAGWKAYRESSTLLTSKYVEIASYQEAQAARGIRAEMRTEVHQFIEIANGILHTLNLDIVSNIDSRSVAASEWINQLHDNQCSKPTHSTSKVECSSISQLEVVESTLSQSNLGESVIPKTNAPDNNPDSVLQSVHQESVRPKTIPLSMPQKDTAVYTQQNYTRCHPLPSCEVSFPQTSIAPVFVQADIKTNMQTSFAGMGGINNHIIQQQADPHRISSTAQPMHEATLHLVKQELFKESNFPFDGDCQRYHSWFMLLQNRMRNVQLDALDQISILIANTSGRPKKLVEDYLAAGAAFPNETLTKIWEALQKQYGSPVRVSQSMQKKLYDFPLIRPPNVGNKMQELAHLCRLIEANMTTNTELQLYNLSLGQKQVWCKLPDWLQKKWRSIGYQFSTANMGALPPFPTLIEFIERSRDELCDPNFEQIT